MAVAILPKRSHSAANVPDTSDLIAGELAVNTADTKIYMRDDSNNIVRVSGQTAAEVTAKAMALAIALG
jgi:hypothetical protein